MANGTPVDSGATGIVKAVSQLSIISVFLVVFCFLIYSYREDLIQIIKAEQKNNEAFQTSLNTNNHLSAGAVNTLNEFIKEIKALREEILILKTMRIQQKPLENNDIEHEGIPVQ